MNYVKFLNDLSIKNANVKKISEHVVQISGVEENVSGFYIVNSKGEIFGSYTDYTTIYRKVDGGYQLSNNGTVYKEPEPYEQTLEEVRTQKNQEISTACQQTIYNGIDVQLSNGETKHYSLKTEDQINLIGKQVQLATDATQFEYHADGEPCEWYSREDMQKIVDTAFQFVSLNTTYCNSFYQYINSITDKPQIQSLVYGIDIPEQYQSPVYKDYLDQMKA